MMIVFSMENTCFPFTRFDQYSHNLFQTIENQTRSFSEYKELIQIKEETRKSLHIDKGKIILCAIGYYSFYFLV